MRRCAGLAIAVFLGTQALASEPERFAPSPLVLAFDYGPRAAASQTEAEPLTDLLNGKYLPGLGDWDTPPVSMVSVSLNLTDESFEPGGYYLHW